MSITISAGVIYNPEDPQHRSMLAKALKDKLGAAGFKLSTDRSRDPGRTYGQGYKGAEEVWVFQHKDDAGLEVQVFTSIVTNGEVRSKGADAIRVCLVYKNKAKQTGTENPDARQYDVGSGCRVYRSGDIDQIVERTVERAREMYRLATATDKCRYCNAPMVKSKQGKMFCSETCWLKKPTMSSFIDAASIGKHPDLFSEQDSDIIGDWRDLSEADLLDAAKNGLLSSDDIEEIQGLWSENADTVVEQEGLSQELAEAIVREPEVKSLGWKLNSLNEDFQEEAQAKRIKPFIDYWKSEGEFALESETSGDGLENYVDYFQQKMERGSSTLLTDKYIEEVRKELNTQYDQASLVTTEMLKEALADTDIYTATIHKDGYSGGFDKYLIGAVETSNGNASEELKEVMASMTADDFKKAISELEGESPYIRLSLRGKPQTAAEYVKAFTDYEVTIRITESEDWWISFDPNYDKLIKLLQPSVNEVEPEGAEDKIVHTYSGTNDTVAGASSKGMYVVALRVGQLKEEGKNLGICIGRDDMPYCRQLRDGEIRVYSIRTSSGKPKFTIEEDVEGPVISQVKGNSNRTPGFAADTSSFTKADEVRLVTEFLMTLGYSPEQIEKIRDMAPGIRAFKDSGQDPFAPPVIKKRGSQEGIAASFDMPMLASPAVLKLLGQVRPWGDELIVSADAEQDARIQPLVDMFKNIAKYHLEYVSTGDGSEHHLDDFIRELEGDGRLGDMSMAETRQLLRDRYGLADGGDPTAHAAEEEFDNSRLNEIDDDTLKELLSDSDLYDAVLAPFNGYTVRYGSFHTHAFSEDMSDFPEGNEEMMGALSSFEGEEDYKAFIKRLHDNQPFIDIPDAKTFNDLYGDVENSNSIEVKIDGSGYAAEYWLNLPKAFTVLRTHLGIIAQKDTERVAKEAAEAVDAVDYSKNEVVVTITKEQVKDWGITKGTMLEEAPWKIIKLRPSQLKEEGKVMKICVGQENMRYKEALKEGLIEIWSLRDRSNRPRFTLEINKEDSSNVDGHSVHQLKGKANRTPGLTSMSGGDVKFADEVIFWINTFKKLHINPKDVSDFHACRMGTDEAGVSASVQRTFNMPCLAVSAAVRAPDRPYHGGIAARDLIHLLDGEVDHAIESWEYEHDEPPDMGDYERSHLEDEYRADGQSELVKLAWKFDDLVWKKLIELVKKTVEAADGDDDDKLREAYDECEYMYSQSSFSYYVYQEHKGSGVGISDIRYEPKAFEMDDIDNHLIDKELKQLGHELENALYSEAATIVDFWTGSNAARGPDQDDIVYKYSGTNETIAGASSKGMYVAKLTPKDLRDESREMGHCIGNRQHGHPQLLEAGKTEVYSIRTEAGKTKFTIEKSLEGGVVSEVKGKANRLPGYEPNSGTMTKPDEVRLVVEFLINHLNLTPSQVEDTRDIRAGVAALKAQGYDPFSPPPKKAPRPVRDPRQAQAACLMAKTDYARQS